MPARFRRGESVSFVARGGRRFNATISDGKISKGKVAVLLSGDPFPVMVKVAQVQREGADVSDETTRRVPEMRKLAKEARLLGISGYESMKAAELRQAIEEANHKEESATMSTKTKTRPKTKSKTKTKAKTSTTKTKPKTAKSKPASKAKTTRKPAAKKAPARKNASSTPVRKKAPAKKAAAKSKTAATKAKSSAPTGDNPFREKSNLHLMTNELMKGGKLQTVVNRLKKKMEIRPWSKDEVEDVDKAITKRVHLAAASLEKDHGFTIEKEGRGPQSTIKAIPPKKGGRRKS